MWDYPEEITAAWPDFAGPAGATVYVSEGHGVHCVGWGNGELHERLGGTSGWLGYPRSDEPDKQAHGSVPVPQATLEFITSHDGLQEKLGFPVKAGNLLTGNTAASTREISVRSGGRDLKARLRPSQQHPKMSKCAETIVLRDKFTERTRQHTSE
jgi:hypothetical protein